MIQKGFLQKVSKSDHIIQIQAVGKTSIQFYALLAYFLTAFAESSKCYNDPVTHTSSSITGRRDLKLNACEQFQNPTLQSATSL